MQENTMLKVTVDADTHIREMQVHAIRLPEIFDQHNVLEIIDEETGELLYYEAETPGDCDYIAPILLEFFRQIGEI